MRVKSWKSNVRGGGGVWGGTPYQKHEKSEDEEEKKKRSQPSAAFPAFLMIYLLLYQKHFNQYYM